MLFQTKQSGERYSSIDFWVKLANYYEYDINEALNCCLLPSARRDVHIGNYSTDHEKEQIKFEIMETLGKQWHGGKGHEYNHYDYSHVVRNLRNYVEQLRKDILNKFGLQSRDVCRADHYEEGREQFEKRMHRLLVNIKDKLDGFRNDPKDSTPYYVSEIAMRYAYGIEGSAKAILFRRIADTKIRVMRILFRKQREQSLEIAWGGEMLLDQQNDNTEDIKNALDGMSQDFGQMTKELTGAQQEISEKIHTENVKCYRNIQGLMQEFAEKMEKVDLADESMKSIKHFFGWTIGLLVCNLAALAGVILYFAGVFSF